MHGWSIFESVFYQLITVKAHFKSLWKSRYHWKTNVRWTGVTLNGPNLLQMVQDRSGSSRTCVPKGFECDREQLFNWNNCSVLIGPFSNIQYFVRARSRMKESRTPCIWVRFTRRQKLETLSASARTNLTICYPYVHCRFILQKEISE